MTSVIVQLSQSSTPSASSAVTTPPTSCTMPVPTRLRIPSASFITREISTPVWCSSKKRTGSRVMRACTRRRMSLIARCAATEITCDSAKPVPACTAVATAAATASGAIRS